MTQAELDRRRSSRGDAEDRGAIDAERIQQAGVCVGLRLGRGIRGQRRPQVAEA
jgi:hypothetical protein